MSFEVISTQFADQLPVSTIFTQVVPNQVVFLAENVSCVNYSYVTINCYRKLN